MKKIVLSFYFLTLIIPMIGQVILEENFQGVPLGNSPATIPAGWTTMVATTSTPGITAPAFKIYNSNLANTGGYWPVPEIGTNNKFAGANDDATPCDCDFIDTWLQTPLITLTDYEYTSNPVDVWGIITNSVVTDIWTDNQDLGSGMSDIWTDYMELGFGPEFFATFSNPTGNTTWNDVGIYFDINSVGLPVLVNINGYNFELTAPGNINISSLEITGDLDFYLASTNGVMMNNVAISVMGNYPAFTTTMYDPTGNIVWNEISVNFDVNPASLPIIVNISGYDFPFNNPGNLDVSSLGIMGDLNWTITGVNGEIINNVNITAIGIYETGEIITDTIPANPGDPGAEVVDVVDIISSTFVGNYTLSFDYFHDQNFGGGDATVQISTDGGASWSVLSTLYPDATYWQSLVLPLYAYNGMDISIRFQWSDNGAWASGFAVDNVIIQRALLNDISNVKTIASDWNSPSFGQGFWEYSNIPITQVSPLKATTIVYNQGMNTQFGVSVNYDVYLDGNYQETFFSNTTDVLTLDKDTLSGSSTYIPSSLGTVSINATVNAADLQDDNPNNNLSIANIDITQFDYARDHGAAQAFVGPGTAYEFGNLFDIYSNDQIGAIDVAVNFDPAQEGALIQGRLYEFIGLDPFTNEPILTDLGVSTIEYAVAASDNNAAGGNNFIHLTFNEPISLEAGKIYMATMISDGSVRMPISGTNDWLVSWLNDGAWGATGGIPMIRLNFDESLAQTYGCTDPMACNFNVSATADDNSCYYSSPEACDNLDNDCDGQVDEELPYQMWYADIDGDGLGSGVDSYLGCSAIPGYVEFSGDCNDFDPMILGGTPEVCDDMDNDCNGLVDEGLTYQNWFIDNDGDGLGNYMANISACAAPLGYVGTSGDCNDADPLIQGGAPETCDALDNDCDGQVDEEISMYYYFDADNDGYGTASNSIYSCAPPVQYVISSDDCNDGNSLINPGFPEICDGIDNNCNFLSDDGLTLNTFYIDEDADGYGGASEGITNCLTSIPGYTTNSEDCNDTLATVNPLAPEIDDNDIDENCDGVLGVSSSINNYSEQDGLLVYPNPAQSFIRLSGLSDLSTLRIFDLTGKEVKFIKNYSASQIIELDGLSSGFYILQIQNETEIKHVSIEVSR
jgi:hypothetical protein